MLFTFKNIKKENILNKTRKQSSCFSNREVIDFYTKVIGVFLLTIKGEKERRLHDRRKMRFV